MPSVLKVIKHKVNAADDATLAVVEFCPTASTASERAIEDGLGEDRHLMLFCHANGFCGRVWAPVAVHLADRYRCLALDFRGHGDTHTPLAANHSWAAMAADILAVLDHFEAPRRSLAVGHSMGGAAILLAANLRREAFSAAWLFEPVVVTPSVMKPPGERLAAAALRRKVHFESREAVRARYSERGLFSKWDPDALEAYIRYGFTTEPDGSVKLKCDPRDEAHYFGSAQTAAIYPGLPKVKMPVAVGVSGEAKQERPPFPSSVALEVVSALPSGVLRSFDDLSHLAPMEDPRRIASDLFSWFNENGY